MISRQKPSQSCKDQTKLTQKLQIHNVCSRPSYTKPIQSASSQNAGRSSPESRVSESTDSRQQKYAKHTAAGIPTWSPTVVLICRSTAYVWQSGRDAQFSADCGRMYKTWHFVKLYCHYFQRCELGYSSRPFTTIPLDDLHQNVQLLIRSQTH